MSTATTPNENLSNVFDFFNGYAHSVAEGKAGAFLGFDEGHLYQIELTAHRLYKERRYDKAKIVLEGLLSLDAERAYAHLLLGDVFLREHDYDAALDCLLAAERLDPESITTRAKIAETYLKKGEEARARELFEQVATMNSEEVHEQLAKRRAQALLFNLEKQTAARTARPAATGATSTP